MTVPASRLCDNTESAIFAKSGEIPWINDEPAIHSKLREVATRYHELRRFLESHGKSSHIRYRIVDDSPSHKRIRSLSEDSIVPEKISRKPPIATVVHAEIPIAEPTEWECKRCTFLNSNDAGSSCAVCGWFKPRSDESTGQKPVIKRELPVEIFLNSRLPTADYTSTSAPTKTEDSYSAILSRGPGGIREHQLTGKSKSSSQPAECSIWASPYNLLAGGQAQEESVWINAVEKDVFAQHNLDEELLFTKRFAAAARVVQQQTCESTTVLEQTDESGAQTQTTPAEIAHIERELNRHYSKACNAITGVSLPAVRYISPHSRLSWEDWKLSGVHTEEFLERLRIIHSELIKESLAHYKSVQELILSFSDLTTLLRDAVIGKRIVELMITEPRCDLNLHCLSHVEGDNLMDRFLIPASMERADMIFSALHDVWRNENQTAFIAARPPGHHCPSFEDRLIGLSSSSSGGSGSSGRSSDLKEDRQHSCSASTKLQRQVCEANGLVSPSREHGMGFCALNALAVALKRFLQLNNPDFQRLHGRSIRVAILDLDIHAGNGTELVFRDSRSVLHVSFHRYGWLNSGDSGAERVMPGTHYYKDVGGIFGKNVKKPRGEGYSVNITLRKGDGNAEVLSSFEAVALPVMQEFAPDLVLVACGFDGLKLSPVFKERWGEGSCPGMDAEYTPSLFGYIVNRVRSEVQKRIVAATEGGYDPLSVGLAARSVVKALEGSPIQKPPLRTFNSDWLPQLNNIFQHQQIYWSSLVL